MVSRGIRLERDALEHHPDRAKRALLAAAGHQQTGDLTAARSFIRLARQWGCDPRLLNQVLISGVYNTLGRAAAIQRDQARSDRYFTSAVARVGATLGRPAGTGFMGAGQDRLPTRRLLRRPYLYWGTNRRDRRLCVR